MFKFTNQDDYLEININYFDNEPAENIGKPIDMSVDINFYINGFAGKGGAYIVAEQMKTFANDVIELEKSRQGMAYLIHVADEINFEIKSIDSIGHLGIICKVIEYDYLGTEQLPLKASAFMEISPEQLVEFAKEWWVTVFTT